MRWGSKELAAFLWVIAGCGSGDGDAAGSGGAGLAAGLPDPDVGPRPADCAPGERLVEGVCVAAGVPPEMCGTGFVPDGRGGCDAELESCAPGMMALVGEASCRVVAPCGMGAWGDIAVEPNTEYVDASYLAGDGDGSIDKPWPTIQQGIDAAAPGAIVAVAAGSYGEDVLIEGKAVRLWGKCPAETELAGNGTLYGVIDVRPGAEGSTIRGLAVTNGPVGIAVDGLEDVIIEEVWIHDTDNLGLMAQDFPNPTAVTLRRSLVEGASGIGLFAWGSTLVVEESIVRDTAPSGMFGRGISAALDPESQRRSTLTLERSIVSGSPGFGVIAWAADVRIDDSLVTDTRPLESDLSMGVGIQSSADNDMTQAGFLVMRRSVVQQSYTSGVVVYGSTLTAEAVVVRDTVPSAADQAYGHGVDITGVGALGPASVQISASFFEGHHRSGIASADAALALEGVIVRDVQPAGDDQFGVGVSLGAYEMASTLDMRGCVVEDVRTSGIVVGGAAFTADSILVRDVAPDDNGEFGHGIDVASNAFGPAQAAVSHSLIEHTHQVGLLVAGGTFLIDSVIVRDVSVNAADTYAWGMALGMSFDIITPGSGSVRYALVEGVPGLGIAAPGEASLSLDGVWVRGLLPSAISDGISAGSGVSAEATYLADIDIRGSRIEGAPRAGVSSFAGRITLAGTLLWCNLIDLNGEDFEGVPSEFHDAGGNGCACNADVRACKLLSSQLEPPAAPTQVEQP